MRRTSRDIPPEGPRNGQWGGRLVKNAVALMISAAGTAILGVAFWGIAAHLASPVSLGRTSAAIAAMVLLASLAQLSFGTIFERFLPVAGSQTRAFVIRAYVMCVLFAFAASIIYLVLGFGHRFLPSSFGGHAFFVVAVVLWTIFILQDSVLIGLRASRWVPVENIFFALAKLAVLPAFIAFSSNQGVFFAWTAPVIVTIVAVTWYLFAKRIPEHQASSGANQQLPGTRELLLLATAQYATLLFSVFTPSIVTLIVIQRLGAVANAHYYVPAIVTSGLALFNWSIIRSFIVEATHEPHLLRRHANTALWTLTIVLVPSVVIGVIFAPEFLRIFGAAYEQHGTTLLRMMLLALPGSAVTIFYSAFAWIDKRVWWLSIREIVSLVIFFGVLLSLIGRHGIAAIGIAYLVSSGVQGLFFLPISIRRYRMTSNIKVDSNGTGAGATPTA
jgi:O-antigen/teichoic acid export membrane protein